MESGYHQHLIKTESKGVIGSFTLAFGRTWGAIEKTVSGFKKLITSEVSLKNIGGPISIGKVATDSFNTSLSYFFQIMALISVNLGVINLFPIPVLDGGHILFIGLEILIVVRYQEEKWKLLSSSVYLYYCYLHLQRCLMIFQGYSKL